MGIFQTFAAMLGDHYVTRSYLKVMLTQINHHIKDTKTDTSMIKVMKHAMRDNLSHRYTIQDQKIMIDITSMLDVQFKILKYNTHPSQMETLVAEAVMVAKK